jgi:hypothetical protein
MTQTQIEFLKMQFALKKVSIEQLTALLNNSKITAEDFEYITENIEN